VSKRLPQLPGLIVAALMMGGGSATAQPVDAPDPTGEWLVAERVARIQIVNCEGRMWGVVSWEMQPGTDAKNPDPALRTRPTLGMPVLLGMSQSKADQWDGEIYNSENGKTYSANISLLDPDTLRVRGCILGFLCGGEDWSRVQPQPANPKPAKPSSSRKQSSKSTNALADPPPETSEQICLRLVGPPGLPHERRLK
jgi:uncharacterized protein (DUF2147 family)